ncbi:MAG: hypothetical protein PHI44_04190 [Candidatus Ratteibacteria bacterium]|nr:hypothetical protein [Candidatus Ratteibacteria bacterium]
MTETVLTVAAGKRLIGKAVAAHPAVKERLKTGTIAIIAGTTNGYVAEEILKSIQQEKGFDRNYFFRGITTSPSKPTDITGRLPEQKFPGDVIIINGKWEKGKTIYDVIEQMDEGDIIIKGANAVDIERKKAGVLIGNPKAGTIGLSLPAVIGRRIKLIIPVGLEKRVCGDIDALAMKVNTPGVEGPRLFPVSGEIITELEAISILTGAKAEMFAAGGIDGAEGSIWLAIEGTDEEIKKVEEIIQSILKEPSFCI